VTTINAGVVRVSEDLTEVDSDVFTVMVTQAQLIERAATCCAMKIYSASSLRCSSLRSHAVFCCMWVGISIEISRPMSARIGNKVMRFSDALRDNPSIVSLHI